MFRLWRKDTCTNAANRCVLQAYNAVKCDCGWGVTSGDGRKGRGWEGAERRGAESDGKMRDGSWNVAADWLMPGLDLAALPLSSMAERWHPRSSQSRHAVIRDARGQPVIANYRFAHPCV